MEDRALLLFAGGRSRPENQSIIGKAGYSWSLARPQLADVASEAPQQVDWQYLCSPPAGCSTTVRLLVIFDFEPFKDILIIKYRRSLDCTLAG